MLVELWGYISKRRQKQFYLIIVLMVVASFAEVISLGIVIPFLGVLAMPEQVYQHQFIQPIVQQLNITSAEQLLFPITILFILSVLFAGVVRLTLLYTMTRISFATGADLSLEIYKRTLYQEYAVHISRNSSVVINGILTKTGTVINGVINPVLTLTSSAILIIAVMVALFIIDSTVAIIVSSGFGLIYSSVIYYNSNQVKKNSECIADKSTQMVKSLQEGLGGIRDVLIDGSQKFYCQLYRDADLSFRRASGDNYFIMGSPRYVVEALGMVLIATLAYILSFRDDGIVAAIPILGTFALGAQRLLPAIQQAYSSYSSIKGAQSSFKDILELLNQHLPSYIDNSLPIPFNTDIRLRNLGFYYTKDAPWVLKNIDLKISKGSRIGFIGVTGSGKSTLLDIIMGLLPPTEGSLTIDDVSINPENRRSWQKNIAHVPQNIYLSDGSIEENIAFGIPKEKIDHQQVEKAAKQAQIAELIEGWSKGYNTFVGEHGIRLSGGQRQRVGIARALYKREAKVLILDEATSALDNETEKSVMESIENLGRELTILIIAHRLTTLKGCDQIVELSKDGVKIGKYDELYKPINEEKGKL